MERYLFSFHMMYKSQFRKMYRYDQCSNYTVDFGGAHFFFKLLL